MRVPEELQILADHEGVKQLLVDDVVAAHRAVFPWVVDEELHGCGLPGLQRLRHRLDVQMELHRVGDTGHEIHAAAATGPWIVRTDVRIHRTDVDRILRWVDRRRRLNHGLPGRAVGWTGLIGSRRYAHDSDHQEPRHHRRAHWVHVTTLS